VRSSLSYCKFTIHELNSICMNRQRSDVLMKQRLARTTVPAPFDVKIQKYARSCVMRFTEILDTEFNQALHK
jgi:hypothetical protein